MQKSSFLLKKGIILQTFMQKLLFKRLRFAFSVNIDLEKISKG